MTETTLGTFFPMGPGGKNRGPFLRYEAWIWQCDDDCNCEQPRIDAVFKDVLDGRFVERATLWEGTFTVDAWEDPELNAKQSQEIQNAVEHLGLANVLRGDLQCS